ncbi:MAG TPA: hypothetical protein VG894_07055, partial [Bauldia sp.]|nr:hypothetical protein [Bauldia sp.]
MRVTIPRTAVAGTIAVAACLLAASAGAASFNCAKAQTTDEKAICHNPALSDLDTQMATLYAVRMKVPMLMGARGDAGDEQSQWLQSRHACGASVACLTGSYKGRI